jgi:hypothetical protein
MDLWQSNRQQLFRLLDHARQLELAQKHDVLWDHIAAAVEMADAGEEGLAFECFCENLHESGIRLTPEFLREVETVGDIFAIRPERYTFLRELLT